SSSWRAFNPTAMPSPPWTAFWASTPITMTRRTRHCEVSRPADELERMVRSFGRIPLSRLAAAGRRMRSELFGGHDPQLADGGVAGAGDHVGDAVGDVPGGDVPGGDVPGGEDLGLLVEGVDHLV